MSEATPPTSEAASDDSRTSTSQSIPKAAILLISVLAGILSVALGSLIIFDTIRVDNISSSLPFAATLTFAVAAVSLTALLAKRADRETEAIRGAVEREATANREVVFHVGEGGTVNYQQHAEDRANTQASDSLQKQEAILREIYTQGLAQARTSFRLSMLFAALGAAILLAGAGLAIKNNSQGQAATITALSGLVIEIVSSLFFIQSNRANANMIKQGVLLREESQSDRLLNASRQVAGGIEDIKLRDEIRAKMAESILRLAGDTAGRPTQDSSAR
ncbi:hypothetical protein GAR05_05624 [Micromonospora saelicesensis]|uniref:Cyanobacterial TRADD-N associated 2 transmembrane domain-containing protein n=1 Tax=Micromonospora saelicesensis TaxID=285676 RepID=A0ABX9CB17_9ACTN|nr:hypothetical protein [Micromonospora saelicesensis]RAN93159.1 hypothetical protein GAR05_05624 [Micromonospora saelicesensis]